FFFSSRRRHTRFSRDWSSDVCSSDLCCTADAVTRRLHPEPIRTYNIDRNINYTNICTAVCDFCAFYRTPKSDEGYVLPREVLLQIGRASGRDRVIDSLRG